MEFLVYSFAGAFLGWVFVGTIYPPIIYSAVLFLVIFFTRRERGLFTPGTADYIIGCCSMLLLGMASVYLASSFPFSW